MSVKSQTTEAKLWVDPSVRQLWVDPEVRKLSVRETFAQPGVGADVGGNPFPDCQAS